MKRATVSGGAAAIGLVLFAFAAGCRVHEKKVDPAAMTSGATAPSRAPATAETRPEFLYGRITTRGGATHEGRLRFGGDQEAFWGDYFNGAKKENPWVALVPPERLARERRPIEVFGVKFAQTARPIEVGRPFMARFGDIVSIEARGRDVRVTLKSGTVFDLDRMDASDFDDGVRVWDERGGAVGLDSLWIRKIELLPTPPLGGVPSRLHGTVRTKQGDFTGFVGWNRQNYVGTDELDGRTAEGKTSLRFDAIRSIARRSRDSSLVTLAGGREIVLSGTAEAGAGSRGISVDDGRFGRVMVSWDAFERVDFTPGESGPAYGDFPPGRPLTGSVTTRAGNRLAGRLVYDLDESETTETLDAHSRGVDYAIPFARIASIEPRESDAAGAHRARVTLHGGEELQLEGSADVGQGHGGVLVYTGGRERPEYVRWEEVQRIDLERAPATSAPTG